MDISYKKLWILLAHNDMSKADLRKKVDISPSTLTKLNKNQYVSLEVLLKICLLFNCELGDIVEIVR